MMEIRTARLRLVRFSESHLTDRYVSWLNNFELMKYSEQRHRQHTRDSCRRYFHSFDGTPHCFWAIEDVTGELGHIGNISAYVDENNCVADIGILIGEKLGSGKGLGLEALIGICQYLFVRRNVRKITAGTMATNKAMIKLVRRAGMIEDGIKRRHFVSENHEVDMLCFALFRDPPNYKS